MTLGITRAIIHNMMGVNVNPYPILLMVNYWETGPAGMATRLDELMKRGVSQVGAFIPWQGAESDISHSLIRFLQMSAERQLNVFLILSPEVGVHYPNSGIPKDLVAKKENLALDHTAEPTTVHLPPNSFALPSYFSADFNKRYYSYMARMDGLFSDLLKNQPLVMKRVVVSLTGSFWKYYRSARSAAHQPFGGPAGDYSNHSALAFRQRTEHLFAQHEFCDPSPSSAQRWKTRGMEDLNRKWFYQHAEDVFRSRSTRAVAKKSIGLKVTEMELTTPEADPSLTFHHFLQNISGGSTENSGECARLSKLVDEGACRSSSCDSHPTAPFVHWTAMGGFKGLAESERQFLLMQSLLLMATRGGGICVDESEWLSIPLHHRTRLEGLIRSLTHENAYRLKNPVLYLSPHLWSSCGVLWNELLIQLGPQIRMVSSIETILKERSAQLLIVDPAYVLTQEVIQKLSAWAKLGRMLVLPRSTLYTENARTLLERSIAHTQKIELTLNIPHTLHAFGDGNLVVYDLPTNYATRSETNIWGEFVSGILSIADIQSVCKTNDHRLKIIAFDVKNAGMAVFILNSTKQAIDADIIFPTEVNIVDLGLSISTSQWEQQTSPPHASALARRFTLHVPALGVLPLKVEGLDFVVLREKQIAATHAKETRESADRSAFTELPGLDLSGASDLSPGMDDLWN